MTATGHTEIEHTADLGFEVWAPGLDDLFAEATLAVAELCYDRESVRQSEPRRLSVEGSTTEELLVRWLQEVYLLLEGEGWLTGAVDGLAIEPGRVRGRLLGESYDAARHVLHTEIKAVTYHDLRVARDTTGLLRARVILDV